MDLGPRQSRALPSWQAADEFGWPLILVVGGAGILAGVIGWFLAGGRTDAEVHPLEAPGGLSVESEGTLWSGNARGWVTTSPVSR